MLKISQIKMPIESDYLQLEKKICELLRIDNSKLQDWQIDRKSIEARRNEKLSYVYSVLVSVKNEKAILSKNRKNNISKANNIEYSLPAHGEAVLNSRPVIIGSGPAGLFCAYILTLAGFKPLILERGEMIEERKKTVENFWKTNKLNSESNVQFGEGGAGTFSDGKLNTGVNDKNGRIRLVLNTFVENGAPKNILYDAKPHVGTDILFDVVKNLRERIISNGGEFMFNSTAAKINISNDSISSLTLKDGSNINTHVCVAAIGHSARDTIFEFYNSGIEISAKAFAVGVRLQHPQEFINIAQWGKDYPKVLGSAPYNLSAKAIDKRGVYTFCMCPGGYVVNASSEENRLAVNGMSYSKRDSGFANSALIITVNPGDYISFNSRYPDELGAIGFQRVLEENAYKAGNGLIPAQRFGDFKADKISTSNEFEPCTKGKWEYSNVRAIFPKFISEDIIQGIESMGRRIKGFDTENALLMGVESRTSSPVRIHRNENFESNIKGLYPCGEGAGYAGGIVSAAVDGIKVAEAIIKKFRPS